jgi:hypothetical protein
MVVSLDRNSLNEINTWPEEVEAKLISLEPGDLIKVRLNQNLWFSVLEQKGTSNDFNRPTSSGVVKKIGQHGIPSPWTIRHNRQPFQIGFLEGYDAQGTARYNHPLFSERGEMIFNGDRIGDREKFFVIQLHPQMRMDPLSGLERRNWKFEIVDAEKESTSITDNFEAKLTLLNKIKDLNEQSLSILMSSGMYERSFFARPELDNKIKASRAVLIKMVEEGRYKDIADAFKRLDEVNKIAIVHDALNSKKLICTESKLMRYDGREICTFAEPISTPNNEVAAINAFRYAAHEPDFEKHVIDFFRESYESAKTTTHKARRGTKAEE